MSNKSYKYILIGFVLFLILSMCDQFSNRTCLYVDPCSGEEREVNCDYIPDMPCGCEEGELVWCN